VTVRNTGESGATGVRAVITVPEGAQLDASASGGPDGWVPCEDDPGALCLPELAPGASSALSVVVRVGETASFPLGSTIRVAVSGAGLEPVLRAVPVVVPPSPFEPLVTGGGGVGLPVDEPGTVRFSVEAGGRTPGRDLVATLALPAGVRWAGTPGETAPWACEADGDSVRCTLAELPVADGGSARADLSFTVVADASARDVAGLVATLTVQDSLGVSATGTVPLEVTGPAPQPTQTVPPQDPTPPAETVPPEPSPEG
jgi:hypothetical protein